MNPALLIIIAVVIGGFLGKDQIEDEITAASDSFTRWDALFQKYGNQYGVPPKWLKAICMNESSLGEYPSVARGLASPTDVEGSKSQDGKSWGLMQMTIPTARDYASYATAVDLNNPDFSVKLAAQHVAKIMRIFPKVETRYLEWVIKSYNQGQGNSQKEHDGKIAGYAGEYWARFQRNLATIERKQGDL